MFNIKNIFLSRKEPETGSAKIDHNELSEQIIECLKRFRSDTFPVGLADAITLESTSFDKDTVSISLALHFAASTEQPEIADYLKAQLGCTVKVSVKVVLLEPNRHVSIKHIILVASGKGGVGKSTSAVNLARGLMQNGAKVGLLDADIYGPSIPTLLGMADAQPQALDDNTLLPFEKNGLAAQSIGFLLPEDDATVWRGPMASSALMQLLNETAWPELDYLVVDMPPGTGDIQLTMSQKLPASGAVIITTPQDLALLDAKKGIDMFNKVNVPIVGLLENMSYFHCQHCDGINNIFGEDGGKTLAQQIDIPLLGQVPLSFRVRETSESGEFISHIADKQLSDIYNRAAKLIASSLFYNGSGSNPVEIITTDD
jgi:ATP-binding protein involved in chromosome partitioning